VCVCYIIGVMGWTKCPIFYTLFRWQCSKTVVPPVVGFSAWMITNKSQYGLFMNRLM